MVCALPWTLTVAAACLAILSFAAEGAAAPSPEQLAKLRAAEADLKQAGQLFGQKKYKDSGEHVKSAQSKLAELAADPEAKELARNMKGLQARLKRAHALLELEGISLPPLEEPSTDKPTPQASAGDQVSFVKEVAPMLVGKCGRCHIAKAEGRFSMSTFAALEKGSADGIVLSPGKSQGSRIIDMIESGDMPRGGGSVSKEELGALARWIDQGAKFDGPDKSLPLTRLVGSSAPTATPEVKLEVSQATGKETVSFAQDIAPVLLDSCTGCHGGRNPRANFSMANFTALLRGGDSDAPIAPGKPADSLLIKKLKGTAGARMPLDGDPLPDDIIAKFEKWISEGAKFDGPDAAQALSEVVDYVFAKNATNEELSKKRMELATEKWRLAVPDDTAEEFETENFLVIGNVGQATLKEIGEIAEKQVAAITKYLRVPETGPFIKGRMTIYVFRQRFDYSEFGKMVEKRSLPDDWYGHWGYNVVDAYGGISPPKQEEYSLEALIGQQVAATYVASMGRVPKWFADGVGRTVASRAAPRDARVREWENRIPSAIAASAKPDAFAGTTLQPEESAVLSYSFVKFLMTRPAQFTALMNAIRAGDSFDAALSKAYGGNLTQLSQAWVSRAASRRR